MNIRILEHQDLHLLPVCLDLLERTQGTHITTVDALKRGIELPEQLLMVAEENDEIIGVAMAKYYLPGSDMTFYKPFGEEIVERLQNLKVGSLSTMSVLEKYRGQGLGQKLSARRQEWLRSHGVNVIVGISWKSGLAHTSDRVFDKMGFTSVGVAEKLFEKFEGLLCPVCKVPPCLCAGELYLKEVS